MSHDTTMSCAAQKTMPLLGIGGMEFCTSIPPYWMTICPAYYQSAGVVQCHVLDVVHEFWYWFVSASSLST